MVKNGRVEIGKSPSVVSGKCATTIVSGEAIRYGEIDQIPDLEKLAASLDNMVGLDLKKQTQANTS